MSAVPVAVRTKRRRLWMRKITAGRVSVLFVSLGGRPYSRGRREAKWGCRHECPPSCDGTTSAGGLRERVAENFAVHTTTRANTTHLSSQLLSTDAKWQRQARRLVVNGGPVAASVFLHWRARAARSWRRRKAARCRRRPVCSPRRQSGDLAGFTDTSLSKRWARGFSRGQGQGGKSGQSRSGMSRIHLLVGLGESYLADPATELG